MKKFIAILAAAALTVSTLALVSCGDDTETAANTEVSTTAGTDAETEAETEAKTEAPEESGEVSEPAAE